MENERLMTVRDVARFLNVQENTIYQYCYKRKIPYLKVGRHKRFNKSVILAWLEKNSYNDIMPVRK
jgi:excisionase family DNA binding protein